MTHTWRVSLMWGGHYCPKCSTYRSDFGKYFYRDVMGTVDLGLNEPECKS